MRLSVFPAGLASLAAITACAHAQPQSGAQIIPLDMSAPRPMVEFQIPGQPPGKAVFDTAAGGSALDRPLAEAAKLPNLQPARVGSGAGGEPVEAFLTHIEEMTIGDVAIEGVDAVVMDIPKPPGHEEMVALFGPKIFSGHFVTLDFAEQHLVLHDTDSDFTPQGVESGYSKEARPLPSIPVSIDGVHYDAHIDTGAPRRLTLPYKLADTLPLTGELEDAGVARVVTGERKLYRGQIKGVVEVGPLRLVDPEVEFLDGLRSVNVGMELLRQLAITLNPDEQRLWIDKAGEAE